MLPFSGFWEGNTHHWKKYKIPCTLQKQRSLIGHWLLQKFLNLCVACKNSPPTLLSLKRSLTDQLLPFLAIKLSAECFMLWYSSLCYRKLTEVAFLWVQVKQIKSINPFSTWRSTSVSMGNSGPWREIFFLRAFFFFYSLGDFFIFYLPRKDTCGCFRECPLFTILLFLTSGR